MTPLTLSFFSDAQTLYVRLLPEAFQAPRPAETSRENTHRGEAASLFDMRPALCQNRSQEHSLQEA